VSATWTEKTSAELLPERIGGDNLQIPKQFFVVGHIWALLAPIHDQNRVMARYLAAFKTEVASGASADDLPGRLIKE
jgi:hypothetical protein